MSGGLSRPAAVQRSEQVSQTAQADSVIEKKVNHRAWLLSGLWMDYSSQADPGAGGGRARCPQRAAHAVERPKRRAETAAPYLNQASSISSPGQ